MKVSLNWLGDFVNFTETDPLQIADRLTKSTGEVDSIEQQGKYLDQCVVGKVLSIEKHPNADKLSIVLVETDQGEKRVVCGGTNLKQGMLVAFAHIGATVKWHGGDTMTLAPVKIRGEESSGMICAAEELELGDSFAPSAADGERPIVNLDGRRLKVGTPLKEALKLNDMILHIDNHAITNRPDLFSHIGIARECVALGLAKWKRSRTETKLAFPSDRSAPEAVIECTDLIPRYLSTTLSIESLGDTPDWMIERLGAVGIRSINLPVDITNYVMLETGMPMHSFDLADIKGTMTIRRSKANEGVMTLDAVQRKLPEGAIVISDNEGIFDLLGIMGGLRSSTKDSTRTIYLHAAIVDGAAIRKAIIATGHRTDAATVYEKNIPLVTAEQGLKRTLELFLELVPGARITSALQSYGDNGTPVTIDASYKKIQSFLGIDLEKKDAVNILKNLGCEVAAKGDSLTVTTPLWRKDLTHSADIAEELARVYGYNEIAPRAPEAAIRVPERDPRLHAVRDALKEARYIELLHLAFISPELLKKSGLDPATTLPIQNPLGEELSLMRPSLLPAILQTVSCEQATVNDLAVYEYGHVFEKESEHSELCLVRSSKQSTNLISEPSLLLKRDLECAFAAAGYTMSVQQSTAKAAWMHPERSSDVLIGDTVIGQVFELHPATARAFELAHAAVAILDWTKVLSLTPAVTIFTAIPGFPEVSYDETFALPTTAVGAILKKARMADPLLASIKTMDLYQKANDRRITLRFTYRAADRTLNETEAKSAHDRVMASFR